MLLLSSIALSVATSALPAQAAPTPVVAAVSAFVTPTNALAARSSLEQEVLAQLNFARTNPRAYADTLREYRKYFRGNIVRTPGRGEMVLTDEGVHAVDEAIRFLERQRPLPPLRHATILALASDDHVGDIGPKGLVSHNSSTDGAEPWDRVMRRGGGDYTSEIIAFGGMSAEEIVRMWVINDGSPDRGHREAVFDDEMHYAGVGCGQHRTYGVLCVTGMARTPNGEY